VAQWAMAHLIVREPGRFSFTVELTDRFDIGRSPDSGIVTPMPSGHGARGLLQLQ